MSLLLALASGDVNQSGVKANVLFTGKNGQGSIFALGAKGVVTLTGKSGNGVVGFAQTGVAGRLVFTGKTGSGVATGSGSAELPNEIELKRWYVRRNNRVYIFNSASEADSFIDADNEANQAIANAQATSKAAKKKIRRKIYDATGLEPEYVSIDAVSGLVDLYGLQFDIQNLIKEQDFETFMRVAMMAREIQDEEDIEFLLLA